MSRFGIFGAVGDALAESVESSNIFSNLTIKTSNWKILCSVTHYIDSYYITGHFFVHKIIIKTKMFFLKSIENIDCDDVTIGEEDGGDHWFEHSFKPKTVFFNIFK